VGILPLLAAALIALLAMLVRGVTGFGAALIMSPLLLLIFYVHMWVVASAAIQIVTGFGIAWHSRHAIDRAYLLELLPGGIIGIIAGTLVLVSADSNALKRLLGVVTILFAVRSVRALGASGVMPDRWPRWTGFLAGALSGFLGSSFGTTGPPIVIYLDNQALAKSAMRATMLSYFFAVDSTRMAGYILSGLLTRDVVVLGLVMLPTAIVGGWLGTRVHLHISERTFRLGVAGLLFVTGALLVVKV
jgi:uncharacterized protein